ncbi:4-hydroxyphenylacetate 3-hydroxylase family protein [Alteribacter aurantiacus]|uniref:4-hydroxyphenylacetate 3-hydroxylase family protein n=1 Tax=Alteribacter aurantiacus TaxID=254410 RepID=UPI0004086FC8|nr:4-hydroxyphenylacetate 3-hydroxylase N-terminal domain-containing protein [Alteribacter aurantiacus]
MAVISGDVYKERIDGLQQNVWIEGKKVEGSISSHPAFKGAIQSQAELYDLQGEQKHSDVLVHTDEAGRTFGTSYLIPKTKEDLEKRRQMVQVWARHTGGLMGRSPDYMNTVLAAFTASVHLLEGEENCFPENIINLYNRAVKHDLSFTHTFINPQNNRSLLVFMDDETPNARVVDCNDDGMVVHGAKLLATQGGMTDEIIVFSPPGVIDESQAFAFSIPSDTKGLTFACRRSFVGNGNRFDSPLSNRFDEMDSVVMFDHVVVPWDRVFYYNNNKVANDFFIKSYFAPFTMHQIVSRQVVKTEFALGVAKLIVDAINISEYEHVQLKLAEMIKGLECARALLTQSEVQAEADERGVLVPARTPLYVAVTSFQELYPRMTEIIELLGASGMVCLPHEEQLNSSIGCELERYMRGHDLTGRDKLALFNLASDLCMSQFGTRQTLYERFFFGDPVRLSKMITGFYNFESSTSFANSFLKS